MNVKEITFKAEKNGASAVIRVDIDNLYPETNLKALTEENAGFWLPFEFNGDEYDGELVRYSDGTLGLNHVKVIKDEEGRYIQDWWNNDNPLRISEIKIKY